MSYAPWALTAPSGYSAIFGEIADINPKGTCFALTCSWLATLLGAKNTGAKEMMTLLDARTKELAPLHADYIRRIDSAQSPEKRGEVIRKTLKSFSLTCDSLPHVDGVARRPAPFEWKAWSAAPWGECAKGDVWCVAGDYILENPPDSATLLQQYEGEGKKENGHALGAFRDGDTIRIYDMNAGEFRVVGRSQWNTWAAAAHDFYNYKVNFIDVLTVALEH
jgi:hypothetical protein